MPTSELYPVLLLWLQALGVSHATARDALARLVAAMLSGQSLRPSALMRALLSPGPVPARQRYLRVARAWTRPWLSSEWLTPRLLPAALALANLGRPADGLSYLVLDSVRCGRWELYTLGLWWHHRVVPVAWSVLPYPLPRGRFAPMIRDLVERVDACWPASGGPVHLLADRAFPSLKLFQQLERLGWGWTVRIRATDGVRLGSRRATTVRELLGEARPGQWQGWAGTFGTGPTAVPGQIMVGQGLQVVPSHQRGPASLAQRQQQWRRRQQHLATKKPSSSKANLRATDRWVALFTSHHGWLEADRGYRRRWAIEGSFRDAQSGWDGKHGWDLEPVVASQRQASAIDRIVGLWALSCLVQTWVGHCARQPDTPALVQRVVGEWCTTPRLSVWARGRLALNDPSGLLGEWLSDTLHAGARSLRAVHRPPHPPRRSTQAPLRDAA